MGWIDRLASGLQHLIGGIGSRFEALVAWLAAVDNTDKALVIGLYTAAGSAVLALIRYGWQIVADWLRRRGEQRAVFRRFLAAVSISRASAGDWVSTTQTEDRTVKLVRDGGADFRFFSLTYVEHDARDAMRAISPVFSRAEMLAIERYVYLEKLLDAIYRQMCSEDFAMLTTERKVAVVQRYFFYFREHAANLEDLESRLRWNPWSGQSLIERLALRLLREAAALAGVPVRLALGAVHEGRAALARLAKAAAAASGGGAVRPEAGESAASGTPERERNGTVAGIDRDPINRALARLERRDALRKGK